MPRPSSLPTELAIQPLTRMRLRESNSLWSGRTSREVISALRHTDRRPLYLTTETDGALHSAPLRWIVSCASEGYSKHTCVVRILYTLSRDTTLKRAFDTYWEEGAERPRMMSIGLHPRLIGQAARISGLKDFLDYALAKGAVWFAKRIDIANWWLEHHEDFKP